jgi:hypothetical protein
MFDLSNGKSYFSFHFMDWGHVLELALHYGWTPLGTLDGNPETGGKDWNGGYTSNSWQYVTPDDAINIANALQRALFDILDDYICNPYLTDIIEGNSFTDLVKSTFDYEKSHRGLPIAVLLRKFSGFKNKEDLKEFIDFCKEGRGFQIS